MKLPTRAKRVFRAPPSRDGNAPSRFHRAHERRVPPQKSENSIEIVSKRDNSASQISQLGKAHTLEKEIKLAATKPIEAAKLCKQSASRMEKGFHDERRRHIVAAYAIASSLAAKPTSLAQFYELRFWDERTKKPSPDPARLLLNVMVFDFGAINNRTKYKRVSVYAKALDRFWTNKVSVGDVEAKIKEAGGVQKLYQAASNSALKRSRPKPSQSLKLHILSDRLRQQLLATPDGETLWIKIRREKGDRGAAATVLSIQSPTS